LLPGRPLYSHFIATQLSKRSEASPITLAIVSTQALSVKDDSTLLTERKRFNQNILMYLCEVLAWFSPYCYMSSQSILSLSSLAIPSTITS